MITAKELLEITKKSKYSAYQEARRILETEEAGLKDKAERGHRHYRFTLKNYYYVVSKTEMIEALTELCTELGYEFYCTETTGNCCISW